MQLHPEEPAAGPWSAVPLSEVVQRLCQLQLIADWQREERPFLLRERPWAHATLIVAGSAVLERVPTAHVAVAPPVIAGT